MEYHVPCGKCMMVAEDCKYYGKKMDEEEQPNRAEYIINRNGVDFIPSSKVLSAVDAKLRLKMGGVC